MSCGSMSSEEGDRRASWNIGQQIERLKQAAQDLACENETMRQDAASMSGIIRSLQAQVQDRERRLAALEGSMVPEGHGSGGVAIGQREAACEAPDSRAANGRALTQALKVAEERLVLTEMLEEQLEEASEDLAIAERSRDEWKYEAERRLKDVNTLVEKLGEARARVATLEAGIESLAKRISGSSD